MSKKQHHGVPYVKHDCKGIQEFNLDSSGLMTATACNCVTYEVLDSIRRMVTPIVNSKLNELENE